MASAPTITTQPVSQSVAAGTSVTFSVVAAGTAPLYYQWKKDGVSVTTGGGGTSYTTAEVGSYTVEVINSYGSVTSSTALLTNNSGTSIASEPSTGVTASDTGYMTIADSYGRMQWSQGISFNGPYTWPSTYFTGDCNATAQFNNPSLFNHNVIVIAGGTSSAKILLIDVADLSSGYGVAWTPVSNLIGQPISTLYVARVRLSFSYNGQYYQGSGAVYNVLLAGCIGGKIAYSTSGSSWALSSSQPFVTAQNDDIVVGFTHWDIGIFAASQKGKVAYSSDGGATWSIVNTDIPANSVLTFITKVSRTGFADMLMIGGENNFLAKIDLPNAYIV